MNANSELISLNSALEAGIVGLINLRY